MAQTATYHVQTWIYATCDTCAFVTGSSDDKDVVDSQIAGHFILAHDDTKAEAAAEVALWGDPDADTGDAVADLMIQRAADVKLADLPGKASSINSYFNP